MLVKSYIINKLVFDKILQHIDKGNSKVIELFFLLLSRLMVDDSFNQVK